MNMTPERDGVSTRDMLRRLERDLLDIDDLDLVEEIRSESASAERVNRAFGELYRRHHAVALAQAKRVANDVHAAEDIADEAFLKMFRAIQGGGGPTTSVLGYLLTAVRTESLRFDPVDSITVSSPVEEVVDLAIEHEPSAAHGLAERDQIGRAFRQLPESWRQIIWLIDIEDVPIETAAAMLELEPSAVRSLSYRAREGLRTAYLQEYVTQASDSCGEHPSLLARFTRARLGKRQRQRVEQHLAECDDCSRQVAKLAQINSLLRSWAGPLIIGTTVGVGSARAEAPSVASASVAPAKGATNSASTADRDVAGVWMLFGLVASAALILTGLMMLVSPSVQGPTVPAPAEHTAEGSERVAGSPEHASERSLEGETATEIERGNQPQRSAEPVRGAYEAWSQTRSTRTESGSDQTPEAIDVEADAPQPDEPVPDGSHVGKVQDDTTPFWRLR